MQKKNLPEWLTPSVIILILANLFPLYGMVFLGWNVFLVIFLFWTENLIIGVFNVARMLIVSPKDPLKWLAKIFLIPFFSFHYGMFTAGHGLFVFGLFGAGFLEMQESGFPDINTFFAMLQGHRIIYSILALMVSHGFSFFWNYIRKGEFRSASLGGLMTQPYARVFILHVTIIATAFLLIGLKSPLMGLFLLVVLKIGLDVIAHVREHKKMEKGGSRVQRED